MGKTLAAAAALLLAAGAVVAADDPPQSPGAPAVRDEGKLFPDEARRDADAAVADIARQFRKEVRVETYGAPPADRAEEFQRNKRDRQYVARFFRAWAEERFRANGTNGLLILMYRDNSGYYAEVVVGAKTIQRQFTRADVAALRDLLVDRMKGGQDARALAEGLVFVRARMAANEQKADPPDKDANRKP